jgi:glycosyltransferase involved in cell wall biosynthesis
MMAASGSGAGSESIGSSPPRNVLLLISDLEFGGAQRQVVELANQMDPRRYRIHVCSLAEYVPLAERLRDREGRFHLVRKAHKFDFTVVPKLVRLLYRLKIDILHAYLFDAEFFGRIAGRIAGVKAIIGSERNTDYATQRRHRWSFALTRWCPHLIIANSGAGAAFNQKTFGLPAHKYRVVHNGVDTERFQPRDPGRVRRELGLAEHHRVVGMFGSFKAQKNHPLLLRAARAVVERFPDVRFLMVGDELYQGMSGSVTYKQEIMALVQELGLAEYCIFAGNREDVENWFPVCDLTVLPSLTEGTPNVALESMACGVPVVATDVSDNRLVIPDGVVGFVVPSGDASALSARICELLGDEALRSRMSQEARQLAVDQFSGPSLAAKTAAVYDEALGQTNSDVVPSANLQPFPRSMP